MSHNNIIQSFPLIWTLLPLIVASLYSTLVDVQSSRCGLANFSLCILTLQCFLLHNLYGEATRVNEVIFIVPTAVSILLQNTTDLYVVQVFGVLAELVTAFFVFKCFSNNKTDDSTTINQNNNNSFPLTWTDSALIAVGLALIVGVPNRLLLGNCLVLVVLTGQAYLNEKQELRGHTTAMLLGCGIEIIDQTLVNSTEIGRFLRIFALILGVMLELVRVHREQQEAVQLREKKLQEELEATKKQLEIKEEAIHQQCLNDVHLAFLANLSHELRTSMNGVCGMIGLLSGCSLSTEAQEYVSTLERSVDSLMNLINDSLNFSRMETQDLLVQEQVPFNLESLLEDAMDLVCSRVGDKNVEVSYDISESVPSLIGDPTHLRSIICNFMSNAIKYTQEGDVFISTTVLGKPTKLEDGESVTLQIEVTDTGPGIPQEHLPHVFEPFSILSAKTIPLYGGSGLGLAMCEKLARVMNGKLSVESVEGKGSTFRLEVPFRVDPSTPKEKERPLSGASVFIIDNSEHILRSLQKMLEGWGCRVQTASNWVDGMKGLKKAAVVSGQPHDLLLLDYTMPGLNGNEVAKLIRKDKSGLSSLSIVMLGTVRQRQMVTASVQGYVIKPIKRNHIWNTVSALCKNTNKERTSPENISKEAHKLHVLIAEDNVMNQKIVKSMVDKMGHLCTIANNGLETIAEWEKQPFDVIFMDCRMPVLDGFEATKRIREKEAAHPVKVGSGSTTYTIVQHIPIIALTADIMHGTRECCLKVGMDDYLSKPVKKQAIEEILQALVDKKIHLERQSRMHLTYSNSDEYEPMNKPVILLVEDNEVNIKIGSVILKKHGFDVHIARGGKQAVDLVLSNPKQYQLILMDMHMPGMDGQTATAHIRDFEEQNDLSPVPIIALTGDTTEGFREMCLASGCSEYMPKPIDYPLLVQLCKNYLRSSRRPTRQTG